MLSANRPGDEGRVPARWAGSEYAAHSDHHRRYDDWFLDRHRPRPGDVVVDLGCGTGEFTARLAEIVGDGRVVGVEPDPSMLATARRHAADNLEFVGGRAQEVGDLLDDASVDVVVSRAMLHWLPRAAYPRVFAGVRRVLRPGGWFHSESAAVGNVPRVVELLNDLAARFDIPTPPPFPDPGHVFELVEAAGFDIPFHGVRSVAQRRTFSEEEILGFLRSQATVALTRASPDVAADTIVDAAIESKDRLKRFDGSYDQTFVRLEILARRPQGREPVQPA